MISKLTERVKQFEELLASEGLAVAFGRSLAFFSRKIRAGRTSAAANLLPSASAIQSAVLTIRSSSDTSLAPLLDRDLMSLRVERGLSGNSLAVWRRLFLSLKQAPEAVLVVPSLDLDWVGEMVSTLERTVQMDQLLVLAADEIIAGVGIGLPAIVEWRSLAEFGSPLLPEERADIVISLVHHLRPQYLLTVGSEACLRAICRRGTILGQHTRVSVAVVEKSSPIPLSSANLRLLLRGSSSAYLRSGSIFAAAQAIAKEEHLLTRIAPLPAFDSNAWASALGFATGPLS